MSSPNSTKAPGKVSLFRKSGVYRTGGDTLFVPSEVWVLIHEASGLPSVLKRAGHSLTYPHLWRQAYGQIWQEFENWLYDWRRRRPPPEGVQSTQVMRDCRREASLGAILRAARKLGQERGLVEEAGARGPRGLGLGPPALQNALRKYRDYPWFRVWLLRGGTLPPEVKLATARQATAARKAWHYTELCGRAGVQRDTYARWIDERAVPDNLRPWLFGEDKPAGVFVVDRALLRLQEQMTEDAIAAAAGLNEGTVFHWNKQENLRKAFEWVTAWAKSAGPRVDSEPEWPELARPLRASTRDNMLAYVRAAKPVRFCKDAKVHKTVYYEKLAEGEKLGARDLLEAFLRRRPPFAGPGGQRCGLVEKNFFVATEEMLAFREKARATAAERDLAKVLRNVKDHPGYREWFLDWTSPRGSARSPQPQVAPTATNGDGSASETAPRDETAAKQKKHPGRRGPKVRTDPSKDQQIWDAWHTRQHANYASLGTQLGSSVRQIEQALDRVRYRNKSR